MISNTSLKGVKPNKDWGDSKNPPKNVVTVVWELLELNLYLGLQFSGIFRDSQGHGTPLWEAGPILFPYQYGKLTIRGSHYWESLESPLINCCNTHTFVKKRFVEVLNLYVY